MNIDELVYGTKGNETYLTLVYRTVTPHDLDRLEQRPAIYKIFGNAGEILYVGETTTLKRRLKLHVAPSQGKKEITKETVSKIEYCYISGGRHERSIIEGLLIGMYKPLLNVDDAGFTESKLTRVDKHTLKDILFYVRKTDTPTTVLSKFFKVDTTLISHIREGLGSSIETPDDFVPSRIITDEFMPNAK